MSDIVERLRKGIDWTGPEETGQTENYMDEAADEIERLRKLLNNIPIMVEKWETAHIDADGTIHRSGIGKQIADDIRAALGGK